MPSRNALCPCGSGRRFKQCHGRLAGDGAADAREKVDFVIAGAQRSGTTTLDLYLREHPDVAMPWTRKELHFFDGEQHFRSEPVDYRVYHANFTARAPGQLRGDATPSYMYWQPTPARMARYNPALKIVVVLRNPITRAYSHWNKEWRRGRETLPFMEALRAEPERARAALPLQIRREAVCRPWILFAPVAAAVAALPGRPDARPAELGAASRSRGDAAAHRALSRPRAVPSGGTANGQCEAIREPDAPGRMGPPGRRLRGGDTGARRAPGMGLRRVAADAVPTLRCRPAFARGFDHLGGVAHVE